MKLLYIILLIFPLIVSAVEQYELIIKDHKFIPETLKVKANEKLQLIIYNQDDEAEEFESFELRREKIIPAKGKVKINIGPLDPGEYKIFGDFHINITKGMIIAN